ncbi:MAG TPA: PqqD family protein [Pyrinomonadaceae bacterium]
MPEHMAEQYLPAARSSKLLVRELAEEVLVYDEEGHRAHCLNRTAALVWKSCDGRTAVPVIAERVGAQLSAPVTEEVVWLALEQLTEFDLLSTKVERASAPANVISRRKMLRGLGIAAAVSLPLITSVVSPTAAEAQSPCNETNCPPPMCCSGGTCLPESECNV